VYCKMTIDHILFQNGHTALHEASRRDQGEDGVVDLLLQAGALVNARDKVGTL
jgi:ankyrin repeat protein